MLSSAASLRYLTLKEVFWYELPGTLRGLTGGERRLYLPSGVMNQVYDTKNRVAKGLKLNISVIWPFHPPPPRWAESETVARRRSEGPNART